MYRQDTYLEANAKTGKNTPRQCLNCKSSSTVGLYQRRTRRDKSFVLTNLPDNISFTIPSAANVRISGL